MGWRTSRPLLHSVLEDVIAYTDCPKKDECEELAKAALQHSALPADASGEPVFEAGEAELIRHAGKVVTRRQLLEEVWGANYTQQSHYLRVYMAQLRHKLEHDPTRPRLLTTEPGVAYRLRDRL
jgi:hypothetical protein